MKLSDLRALGRSGLPVSPFALGTMTFGNAAWGSPDDVSRAVFDAYVDAGGNFVDTADVYSSGRSEELLGRFIAERNLRDRIVLATKYAFNFDTSGDTNAAPSPLHGGSGRKNLHRALEGSLRRLGTDYVDLYWMHVWDGVTPAEEVLEAMSSLVRAGKIRYYGLSDVPAWFAARVATLAQAHGQPAPVAMQMFYSLVERSVEREHLPAARELGMSMVPWSPLAYGLLTGKYMKDDPKAADSRLSGPNPFGDTLFTDQNWRTVDALREVSGELGISMSHVALAWLLKKPGVTSVLLGARKVEQLADNLAALEVDLSDEIVTRLDEATGFDLGLYALAKPGSPLASQTLFAGARVEGWR
jgi:aryl-alcohol dehydrogenase-like predicted oxidoreductase